MPRVRDGFEMGHTAGVIVDSVIQFHRLIPVVHAGRRVKVVVAGSLGRHLYIWAEPFGVEAELW